MKINCVETDENVCHIKKKSDGKEFMKATTVHSFENICEKKDNWLVGDKLESNRLMRQLEELFVKNPNMFLKYLIFNLKM